MKKLLLVLLVLGLSTNAYAVSKPILIYSYQQKTTEYIYDGNMIDWSKSTRTETGYLIVQQASLNSINVWTVKTGKGMGKDGKMHKFASAEEEPVRYFFAEAHIGAKTTWLAGYNSEAQHIMLKGDAKPTRVLPNDELVATKLAGTSTWIDEDEQNLMFYVGSAVISLKWQSKLTSEVMSDILVTNGEDAVDWLFDYLIIKGYLIEV